MDKVCDICGGSGQIGIFRGVSRFVISWEECPECFGTGIEQAANEDGRQADPDCGSSESKPGRKDSQ